MFSLKCFHLCPPRTLRAAVGSFSPREGGAKADPETPISDAPARRFEAFGGRGRPQGLRRVSRPKSACLAVIAVGGRGDRPSREG